MTKANFEINTTKWLMCKWHNLLYGITVYFKSLRRKGEPFAEILEYGVTE